MIAEHVAIAVLAAFIMGGALALWIVECGKEKRRAEVQTPAPHSTGLGQAEPIVFVRAWRPLTPEQWAAAFRDWPDSDPRWRALWDLLAHHLEAELADAGGAKADAQAICQWHGRVQMLLFLRSQVLNLRRVP